MGVVATIPSPYTKSVDPIDIAITSFFWKL